MKIECILGIIMSIFLFGCKSNSLALVIKNSITLDENNNLIGTVRIQNFREDTLLIPRELDILPKDKVATNDYLELYQKNGGNLDTLESDDFDFTPVPLDFFLEEDQLLLHLLPSNTYEYHFNISNFYYRLNKGSYLLKVCFKPEFNTGRDTCIMSSFNLKKDLD